MKVKFSISELANLTGFDRRTISKRLANLEPEVSGTAHLYSGRSALPLLYEQATDHDRVDLAKERALLAAEQRRKLEMQNDKEAGALCRAVDVERDLARIFKSLAHSIETFPDRAEREHGATPGEVQRLQELGDALRETLYQAAVDASTDPEHRAE